jgi:type IV pilus assembly protein PilA
MTSPREFAVEFFQRNVQHREKGFTLTEILVTILILGVLAAVAIPGFTKAKTKAEKDQAVAYLRTVRTSMRMYYGKWKTYLPLVNASEIKSMLGAETQAANYGFSVAAPGAPNATTFTATAFRSADSKKITLDQDGNWGGDIPPPS